MREVYYIPIGEGTNGKETLRSDAFKYFDEFPALKQKKTGAQIADFTNVYLEKKITFACPCVA